MKSPILLAAAVAFTPVPAAAQDLPDHSKFAAVLSAHLHNGLVDYAAIRADRTGLDNYIDELGSTSATAVNSAPRDTQLAFWINAYNACTMRRVVDHYPIERRAGLASIVNRVRGMPANSIRQIPNTFDGAFCTVAGKERSLDEIEHEIIRPMGEPRIHFAVNCAALSCPALAAEPYTGDALDEQLDASVAALVANSAHYRLERNSRPVVHLNKVLDWYKDDFGGEQGVLSFLLPYLPEGDREFIESNGPAQIEFEHYDWTLNDTAVFPSHR